VAGAKTDCRVAEVAFGRGHTGLVLENDEMAVIVLPGKGGDITSLVAKPEGVDVLWRSPWGLPPASGGVPTATHSEVAWMDAYQGGWQEIFPSGGGPCAYKGVELNFHGEASTSAWDAEVREGPGFAEVALSLRLRRSPFKIERTMRVEAGRPVLLIRERVANEGGEPMAFMWGHHPAYGAPFLSGGGRIDTNARSVRADDRFDGPHNPLTPGKEYAWPNGERNGATADLSLVPAEDGAPRQTLAYLGDFAGDHGWYAITNRDLGLAVGLVWPTDVFPFAWFWQEMHASAGYPFYQGVYVMAIEPFSSWPGQGLAAVIEKSGTQRTLDPGEAIEVALAAVLHRGREGVANIAPDGTVAPRGKEGAS
jgi:galactose mutarotase-like enzyme